MKILKTIMLLSVLFCIGCSTLQTNHSPTTFKVGNEAVTPLTKASLEHLITNARGVITEEVPADVTITNITTFSKAVSGGTTTRVREFTLTASVDYLDAKQIERTLSSQKSIQLSTDTMLDDDALLLDKKNELLSELIRQLIAQDQARHGI